MQRKSVAVPAQHDIAIVESLQRRAMADRDDGGRRQLLLEQFVEGRLRRFVKRSGRFIEKQILRLMQQGAGKAEATCRRMVRAPPSVPMASRALTARLSRAGA